jgi:hypothetical protein
MLPPICGNWNAGDACLSSGQTSKSGLKNVDVRKAVACETHYINAETGPKSASCSSGSLMILIFGGRLLCAESVAKVESCRPEFLVKALKGEARHASVFRTTSQRNMTRWLAYGAGNKQIKHP